MKRSVARVLVVSGLATGLLAVAAPASAHVTVNSDEATQGGYARVVFRMPTESDTASTTELQVHLPEQTPVPTVSILPIPGWTAEVTSETLAEPIESGHGRVITEVVSAITWTADDEQAALAPGEFGEFPVSLGPLPEVDELVFRALQTYSDGTVVRWIDLPEPDGAEPPFPAPVLRLDPVDHGSAGESATIERTGQESGGGVTAGIWLGLVALLAGVGGLVMGAIALVRTRR